MFRFLLVAMCLISGAAPLFGVTMQQLSMDDLAVQSTAIIRGHVAGSYAAMSGQTVYTHYQITVSESWKGSPGTTIDVAIPGGISNGVRQTFPGVPQLVSGVDYVLYLWTSPQTGMTFPTGFSQGIFTVTGSTSTGLTTSRAATSELMLNAKGQPVQDSGITMPLPAMKSQVATALSRQASGK